MEKVCCGKDPVGQIHSKVCAWLVSAAVGRLITLIEIEPECSI